MVKSHDKQTMSRAHYYGLDVLRFGSALSVAIFHLLFWSWAGIYSTIDQTNHLFSDAAQFPFAVGLTWYGWVAVEVFFVISGFVIANAAISSSPMEFLAGRVLRLYPAVWICATGSLAALYFIAGDPFSALFGPYVKSLLLIPRSRWIDGVYWSLAVEVSFYALVFLILLQRRFSLVHAAWGLTFYSGIFNVLYLATELGAIPSSHFFLFLSSHTMALALLLLPHGCLFAVGIWLWLVVNGRMTTARWAGLAIALVAGGTEVYARAFEFVSSVPAATGQSPLVPLAIWLAATFLIGFSTRGGSLSYAAPGPYMTLLKYVGLVTYPLYLIHNIVGAGISRLLIAAGLNALLAVSLTLIGLLGLCWLFCWGVEPAIRNLLRRSITYFEEKILRPRWALGFRFTR